MNTFKDYFNNSKPLTSFDASSIAFQHIQQKKPIPANIINNITTNKDAFELISHLLDYEQQIPNEFINISLTLDIKILRRLAFNFIFHKRKIPQKIIDKLKTDDEISQEVFPRMKEYYSKNQIEQILKYNPELLVYI